MPEKVNSRFQQKYQLDYVLKFQPNIKLKGLNELNTNRKRPNVLFFHNKILFEECAA